MSLSVLVGPLLGLHYNIAVRKNNFSFALKFDKSLKHFFIRRRYLVKTVFVLFNGLINIILDVELFADVLLFERPLLFEEGVSSGVDQLFLTISYLICLLLSLLHVRDFVFQLSERFEDPLPRRKLNNVFCCSPCFYVCQLVL